MHTCGGSEVVAESTPDFTSIVSNIAQRLYKGKLKPTELHKELTDTTYNHLLEGAEKGFGKDWIKFDAVNSKTVQTIKQNLYLFSGVKSYQQLVEFNHLLIDEAGKIRKYSDFKRLVLKASSTYNQNYLQAEYQTAKKSAQMARKWQEFQEDKDLFPNLIYRTVGDARVREEHQDLEGIIRAIDDPFWDVYYPPNGFRCRCSVQATDKSVNDKQPTEEVKPNFQNNVGKTGEVFTGAHPYFTIPNTDKKAVRESLESLKLKAPYKKAYTAKNGAEVFVNVFADPADLFGNYRTAIKLADNGYTVKIRPHVHIDNFPNPEYIVDDIVSDRKNWNTFNNFSKKLSDAKAQCNDPRINKKGKFSLVFDINQIESDIKLIIKQLSKSIHKNRGRSVASLFFVKDDEVIELTREEIVKRDFTKLLKIQ